MELKAKIRNKTLQLAVGATFSEELSETLDSGVIIADNSDKLKLRPYDDVFVYDGVFTGVPLPYSSNSISMITEEDRFYTWGSNIDYASELTQSQNSTLYTASGLTKFKDWFLNCTPLTEEEAPYRFMNNLTVRISMAYDSGGGIVITTYYNFVAYENHGQVRELTLYNPAFGTFKAKLGAISPTLTIDKTQSVVVSGTTYTIFDIDIKSVGLNTYQNKEYDNISYTFYVSGADGQKILTTSNRVDEKIRFRISGIEYLAEITLTPVSFILDFPDFSLNFAENPFGDYTAYLLLTDGRTLEFVSWLYFSKRGAWTAPTFYKHMLVDTYTEERVNLIDNIYKYKISLMSETKGLERVQLPNKTFKQPFNIDKKLSVYEMAESMVKQYSPKIKVVYDPTEKTYLQQQKYWLDDSIAETFSDVYIEVNLNNPTLRDLLNYLFSTKDRVAVVRDNIIYAEDQTERLEEFVVDDDINFISSSMSSDNYAGNLKRNYNKAIAQTKGARRVEYLGFRDRNNALLTLDNLKLETRFDIYNIDRVLMCYYKKVQEQLPDEAPVNKMIICKQDITSLVVEETRRQLLSKDWSDFTSTMPTTVEELSEYRLATVGYQRGSKEITGWGTIYSYPQLWWDNTKSYLENILIYMDSQYPFGINTYGYLKEDIAENKQISSPFPFPDCFIHPYSNTSLGLKSVFFLVEYTPFYDGTLIHSKDGFESDIVANDNPSSSLTMLESDGLFQKEKINRLGNELLQINGNHESYTGLRKLQSVYGDDVVIFKREYAIYNDSILASYNGTKDFVLKNYFTSVFSKLRPFPLLSYEESVIRAENKKVFMLLSKDTIYNDTQLDMGFSSFPSQEYLLLSGLSASPILKSLDNFDKSNQINAGYFLINGQKYLSDVQVGVSGYSLYFNLQMYDNISGGQYINKLNLSNIVGSEMRNYIAVDDNETGFIGNAGVYVCHLNQAEVFNDKVDDFSQEKVDDLYTDILTKMPKMVVNGEETNLIGGEYKVNKDNQEVLDFTFQIEPITTSEVMISQWLMKLSDLYGVYNRVASDYVVTDENGTAILAYTFASVLDLSPNLPLIQIDIPTGVFGSILAGQSITAKDIVYKITVPNEPEGTLTIRMTSIQSISTNVLEVFMPIDILVGGYNYTFIKVSTFYRFGYQPTGFDSASRFDPRYPFGWNTDTAGMYSYGWVGDIIYAPGISSYDNGYSREMVASLSKDIVNGFLGNSLAGYLNVNDGIVSQSLTYNKNMYMLISTEYLKKNLVYNEYKLGELPTNYTVFPFDFGSGFELRNDSLGVYIEADISHPDFVGKKTLEYWFLDEESNSLKFVLGVNLNATDIANGYVKIRVSFIGNKDMRVYDSNSQLVGERANYYATTLPLDKNHYIDIIE